MAQDARKPSHQHPTHRDKQTSVQVNTVQKTDIVQEILQIVNDLKHLKDYPIRDLVKHAEKFGPYLKKQRLETNQIRKFLDAINQLKARLTQDDDERVKQAQDETEKEKLRFEKIEADVVLLKPKLAYAAARQDAVKSLSKVMSAAIDRVHNQEDFERLVQLIESIIAYHKAEDGK
jgi:CRISPR-associated protein Csm2